LVTWFFLCAFYCNQENDFLIFLCAFYCNQEIDFLISICAWQAFLLISNFGQDLDSTQFGFNLNWSQCWCSHSFLHLCFPILLYLIGRLFHLYLSSKKNMLNLNINLVFHKSLQRNFSKLGGGQVNKFIIFIDICLLNLENLLQIK